MNNPLIDPPVNNPLLPDPPFMNSSPINSLPCWKNYKGYKLPNIDVNPFCGKCQGNLIVNDIPCSQCYENAGFCPKCYGTKFYFEKNKPCVKCDNGRIAK